MDNRRLLIAAVLSLGVLILWQYLFPAPKPAPPRAPASAAAATGKTAGAAPASEAPPTPPARAAPAPAAAAPPAPVLPSIEGEKEESFVLENDSLRAEFSNRGAVLRSLTAKLPSGTERVELVTGRTPGATEPFALTAPDGEELPVDKMLFAATRERGASGEAIHFRYRGAAGDVEKSVTLEQDGLLDVAVRVAGGNFALYLGPGVRARDRADLANRFDRRLGVWYAAGDATVLDPSRASEPVEVPGGGLGWAGLEDTHFLSAFIAEEGLSRVVFRPVLLAPGDNDRTFEARPAPKADQMTKEEKALPRDFDLLFEAGGERLTGKSYWGTKQYDRLAAFGRGLEASVNWGWLKPLTRPLLIALRFLYAHVAANYGWAIVLLTTALKLALLPLSIASFRSMRKMQALNPRIQAIRDRFRGKLRDKSGRFVPAAQQQMNEEIMGLYRAEGVNPAGGCLPILVQLPIFFAFYRLLSTTVELWKAPWMFWIHDLAAMDPTFALPIVMGVTQIVQQRMTPAPPDPVQKRLMQVLPLVWTFSMAFFPSGLVLYWLTNNVLSIAQQAIYNRYHPTAAALAGAGAPASGKRSGGR